MAVETVFYDGDCGLCHRSVRFLLAADREGQLRFAPLQGETFRSRIEAHDRAGLPESLVVLTESGRLLTRSDATVHLLRQLEGPWRVLGVLLAWVPRRLRDVFYDLVVGRRHRLFEAPGDACPVASPQLRARFDP